VTLKYLKYTFCNPEIVMRHTNTQLLVLISGYRMHARVCLTQIQLYACKHMDIWNLNFWPTQLSGITGPRLLYETLGQYPQTTPIQTKDTDI